MDRFLDYSNCEYSYRVPLRFTRGNKNFACNLKIEKKKKKKKTKKKKKKKKSVKNDNLMEVWEKNLTAKFWQISTHKWVMNLALVFLPHHFHSVSDNPKFQSC